MSFKWSYLPLVLFVSLAGCAWFSGSPDKTSFASDDVYSSHAQINLPRGAKLVIIPFTAGAGVVENDELENVSFIMLNGITDAVSASAGALQVVDPEMAKQADYLIEGHITDIGHSESGLLPWIGAGKPSYLGVEILVEEAKTGNVLMQFTNREDAKDGSVDVRQLALKLGREFAQWLVKRTE